MLDNPFHFYHSRKNNIEPIRVFVGCTPAQELIVKVLEWSIRKNTKKSFNLYRLHDFNIPFNMPKSETNRPGTPFSFQRYMIPEICNFKGRAIYLDSDQLVTDNISKLYYRPLSSSYLFVKTEKQGKITQRSSVFLIDCERERWKISRIIEDLNRERYSYEMLMRECPLSKSKGTLPSKWNQLDSFKRGTGIVHFTRKKTQPWLNTTHKDICANLWFKYLFDAIENKFITKKEVTKAIDSGFIRPSVHYQVKNKVSDPRKIPNKIKKDDREFINFCSKYKFNNVPGDYRN